MSLNNFKKIKDKGFPLSIRGYSTKEIDNYIRELLLYCEKLLNENEKYKEKLLDYQTKDEYFKKVLVKAERIAQEVLEDAEKEANEIKENAKTKSNDIISEAMREKDKVLNDLKVKKDKYDKLFSRYIQEGRSVLDTFFVLARKHVDSLKNDFIKEVLNSLEGLDKEFKDLDSAANTEENLVKNDLFVEGDALLVGRQLKDNIKDENEEIIITKGTVITPELVNEIIARGFYGELVATLEEEKG
jgi:cell division initiation protein